MHRLFGRMLGTLKQACHGACSLRFFQRLHGRWHGRNHPDPWVAWGQALALLAKRQTQGVNTALDGSFGYFQINRVFLDILEKIPMAAFIGLTVVIQLINKL